MIYQGEIYYLDSLLQNGFLEDIINILQAEKRLTIRAKHLNILPKNQNLSDPVLICLNNIVLTEKYRNIFITGYLISIAQKVDITTSVFSKLYIARFFAIYTKNTKITDVNFQMKLISCCRVLIADQIDKKQILATSDNEEKKLFLNHIRYTGQILYHMIKKESCDLSILVDSPDYPSIIQEWLDISIKFKLKEPIIFLSSLVLDDNPILNFIRINLPKLLKRALMPKNPYASSYIDFFTNYIEKRPEIIIDLPDISLIINNLLPEWNGKKYYEKVTLIPFVCNYIIYSSFDKMKDLIYLPIMELLEESIDNSMDEDLFLLIIQMLLKFNDFANRIQLNDSDIMPAFNEVISITLDAIDSYDDNSLITKFIQTFSVPENQ